MPVVREQFVHQRLGARGRIGVDAERALRTFLERVAVLHLELDESAARPVTRDGTGRETQAGGVGFARIAVEMTEPARVTDGGDDALDVPRLGDFTAVQPAALQRGQRNLHAEQLVELVGRRDRRRLGAEKWFHERDEAWREDGRDGAAARSAGEWDWTWDMEWKV
jgi:hypothetical protein